jgi:hypothetical protein
MFMASWEGHEFTRADKAVQFDPALATEVRSVRIFAK